MIVVPFVLATVLAQTAPVVCVVRPVAEARYTVGYDHWVHLYSSCDFPVQCTVYTNVNPQAVPARVPPRGHVQVLTWRGSPASVFSSSVNCGPAKG
jgi:hypothetical protein